MKQIREAIDRMNQCMNRLDRLYYMAARKLGVKDNSLLLYYVLSDEKAHSQKEISEEWLVPRGTGPGTDSERIFFRPYERNGGVYGLHAGRISKGDI